MFAVDLFENRNFLVSAYRADGKLQGVPRNSLHGHYFQELSPELLSKISNGSEMHVHLRLRVPGSW